MESPSAATDASHTPPSPPPIRRLVLAGGGPLGLRFLGALKRHHDLGNWRWQDIRSIYGTSVGALLGVLLCLCCPDLEMLVQYVVERPWHEAVHVGVRQLLDAYHKKGLFDSELIATILRSPMEARGLSPDTATLHDLFVVSGGDGESEGVGVDLHLFTFELNSFCTVELSHTTHPDMLVVQAVAMSAALPGLFMPVFWEGGCYLDGGVLCNFPSTACLRDHGDEPDAAVLGIQSAYPTENCRSGNAVVTPESTMIEYAAALATNATNYLRETSPPQPLRNVILCHTASNPLSVAHFMELVQKRDLRAEWVRVGAEVDAATWGGGKNG